MFTEYWSKIYEKHSYAVSEKKYLMILFYKLYVTKESTHFLEQ